MALPLRVIDLELDSPVALHAPLPRPGLVDSELAHTIAHDLRSPLTAIQMCAESLAYDDSQRARDRHVEIILAQARSIAWALDDPVAIADEHSWCEEDPMWVDAGQMLHEALAAAGHELSSRGVHTRCDVAPQSVRAWGREGALRQAIRNCTEAVGSAVQPGGELTLAGTWEPRERRTGTTVLEFIARRGPVRPSRVVPSRGLPWHRLPLLAASRVIAAHGGTLTELRGPDHVAARLTLPLP